ncbi:MAG: DUF4236 domain-containing protein, partial [Prevotellaceae bacterium]|nr:DUF4236 domain-containing protein [Prevotellaceae bacterium]
RTTLSKRGAGISFGIPFFRVGISPTGRRYISFGIPCTGFYFIKYFSKQKYVSKQQSQKKQILQNNQNEKPWWKQKHL